MFPIRLEKHHLLPLHAGEKNNSENLVLLSVLLSIKENACCFFYAVRPKNNKKTCAHFYRILNYKDKNEKKASLFCKNDKREAFLLRSQQAMKTT